MTDANGQEYPGAPAHDYDCPVGGTGGDYDGHGPGFDAGDYGRVADDGLPLETRFRPVRTETVHVVSPRLPMVGNPVSPEEMMVTLGWPLPTGWRDSVATFRRHGVYDATLGWLIAVTQMKHDLPTDARFRYFCGCAWRTIRGE
ncbi:hypothetical protein SEA_MARIOKART_75 [Gordonia phage Mariokart]|nr:hypothetical protein SEA_MARIOKART_75 [Gordonia phage Mariokart]